MSPSEADDEATADEAEADDTAPDDTAPDDTEADDTEPDDEELSEQDEQDINRLDIALATLDDESLRSGLAGITEKQRQDLATQPNLPRATVHPGDALAPA